MMEVISKESAMALGLKKYFSGESCCHGHIAPRFVTGGKCVECNRDANRRAKEYHRKYREDHQEEHAAYCRAYYEAHREDLTARKREYRRAFPEKERASQQRWRGRNEERLKAYWSAWAKQNKEKCRQKYHNRRSLKRAVSGSFNARDIKEIYDLQKGRCAYCKTKLKRGRHIDHITPLSRGGSNERRNIQLTCAKCNSRRRSPILSILLGAWEVCCERSRPHLA